MTASDALAAAMAEALTAEHEHWISYAGLAEKICAALTPGLLWDYLVERGWAVRTNHYGFLHLYRRVTETP